ncbi:aldehyde dehydrogenase family protein [Nonomuraea insulae]|uniref:Aldehyde dehydrogenase family protein n=1 Tax=Nonomuraea insulae TaxID=1616787 RepID=A0ABW1CNR1_9ACTN
MTSLRRQDNYFDGGWVAADTTSTYTVVNPATGDPVTVIPETSEAQVDQAVRAAAEAWRTWRRTNPFKRAGLLHLIGDRVAAAVDAIATEITVEMGKPLNEARGEVRKLAQAFHFYAEETTRTFGSVVPNAEDGFTSIVQREPVGVVAAITPWNYPVELVGWKLAAALGAGCTIVVKPSEYSPSSAVEVFRCLDEVGLPPGVANLVLGAGTPGRALASHELVNKIAFTGSAATGAAITRSSSGVVPMSMELGGSCPLIVTAHADLDAAVTGTVRRSFRNAGQICIAINRAYVHEDLYPAYLDRLRERIAALVVGDGMKQPDADMGPVTNLEILERCDRHVDDARQQGARVVTGGGRLEKLAPGYFFEPTVLADTKQDMLVMHEETFGPLLGVTPFRDLADAIGAANSTPAGLAAYVYSNDLAETFRLGRELDFGNVAVNNVDAGIMNAPYGGRKGSGYGYEHGRAGLDGYLQLKHLRIRHGDGHD